MITPQSLKIDRDAGEQDRAKAFAAKVQESVKQLEEAIVEANKRGRTYTYYDKHTAPAEVLQRALDHYSDLGFRIAKIPGESPIIRWDII